MASSAGTALVARLGLPRCTELAVLGACACWGGSFVVTKDALRFTSPLVKHRHPLRHRPRRAAVRVRAAAGARARRRRPPLRRPSLRRLRLADRRAGAHHRQPQPLFTALCLPLTGLCGALLLRRRPTAAEVVGTLLAVAGIALITTQSGGSGRGTRVALNAGDFMTLGCAVAYSVHNNALAYCNAPARGKHAFETVAVGQVATCCSALRCARSSRRLACAPRRACCWTCGSQACSQPSWPSPRSAGR